MRSVDRWILEWNEIPLPNPSRGGYTVTPLRVQHVSTNANGGTMIDFIRYKWEVVISRNVETGTNMHTFLSAFYKNQLGTLRFYNPHTDEIITIDARCRNDLSPTMYRFEDDMQLQEYTAFTIELEEM